MSILFCLLPGKPKSDANNYGPRDQGEDVHDVVEHDRLLNAREEDQHEEEGDHEPQDVERFFWKKENFEN